MTTGDELVPYRLDNRVQNGTVKLQHYSKGKWVTIGTISQRFAQQVVDHLNMGVEWSL